LLSSPKPYANETTFLLDAQKNNMGNLYILRGYRRDYSFIFFFALVDVASFGGFNNK
jgi:hypothetical protein